MPYSKDYIQDKLTKELDLEHIEVVDQSDGCGNKFAVLIVSKEFEGKTLLQRHRLVNSILKEELKEIHAFSQSTLTPEQWKVESEHKNKATQ
ncbi:bolA-like protein 2 [Chelonus insularis]|uniref:bolA-like protein 2 n=1 Tax=Chelonus insularis TaxID=460826 RepID=UPI001588BD5E|nr:bolA-like protein 2 [Chelonus insularis]